MEKIDRGPLHVIAQIASESYIETMPKGDVLVMWERVQELEKQRDDLQARNTELVMQRRAVSQLAESYVASALAVVKDCQECRENLEAAFNSVKSAYDRGAL